MDLNRTSGLRKRKNKNGARPKTPRERLELVAGASRSAAKLFLALQSHENFCGFRLPPLAVLHRESKISRNTFFMALNELESIGALDRKVPRNKHRNWPRGGGNG